jgi:hypothetical protein
MNAQVEPILESSVDIALSEAMLNLVKIRARWAAHRDFFAPIVAAFQRIGVDPKMDSANYLSVTMTGDKDKLAAAFRILRGAGFTFTADRPKKGDSEWYAFFSHTMCPVDIWFSFTSSVCRRVKVGTKTVQQDIYETVCGDISEAIAPPVEAVTAAAVELIP